MFLRRSPAEVGECTGLSLLMYRTESRVPPNAFQAQCTLSQSIPSFLHSWKDQKIGRRKQTDSFEMRCPNDVQKHSMDISLTRCREPPQTVACLMISVHVLQATWGERFFLSGHSCRDYNPSFRPFLYNSWLIPFVARANVKRLKRSFSL